MFQSSFRDATDARAVGDEEASASVQDGVIEIQLLP